MARRLAAILAADVVDFPRLMRSDRNGTLAALLAHRRDLVDPLLAQNRARIFKVGGGAALVEFVSVADALRFAVAVQRAMEARNAGLPENQRILFRMGVHLGDIVDDAGEIHGDGVSVAACLEAQATPGGIAVSAAVREQVGDKEGLRFIDLGERVVRIGDRPLHSFAVDLAPASGAAPPATAASAASRPSIAVLPFENLTQDAAEDYFSAGVAEDLITELSKISGLFVAARRSSFAVRQSPQDAMATCARLKVGYVLGGSVRRAGERVRITARLVEGATGGQVWAERYDRTLTDIFAVQDEISRSIVRALEIKLLSAERAALARPPTANIEAYNLYLRGLALFGQRVKPSYELARRMFVRAAELDPDFARALAGIAECDCGLYMHCGASVAFDAVLATTERAVALEPSLASAHAARGIALLATGQPAEAERAFERAIAVDPGHAGAHYAYGRACAVQGRREQAASLLRRAADLAPEDVGFLSTLFAVYNGLGRTADTMATAREAVARCERQLDRHPDFTVAAFTGAGALALLGERERALAWARRALAIEPDDHMTLYNVACVYAVLGLHEEALDLLERAMPDASAHRHDWMRQDPDMAPLREHPRFVALCARLGMTP
jgi:adenylate cyclase